MPAREATTAFPEEDCEALPLPRSGERPVHYADRVGGWYAERVSADHRKEHGLYLTPVAVADFMATGIAAAGTHLRLLDPAAGAGILLCALVETLAGRTPGVEEVDVVACEVDSALIAPLNKVLGYLKKWAARRGLSVRLRIAEGDFVLAHAAALASLGELFPHGGATTPFDVVIANPPYFKISRADPRAQAALAVVHGQPNIYSLFMAVGAALLRQGGEFVFITPRSFASGPYFQLFRRKFFGLIRPEQVHVFGSRRDAFSRDEVLQENIILKGVREDGWLRRVGDASMVLSTSSGIRDIARATRRVERLAVLIDGNAKDRVFRLPVCAEDDEALRLVDSWACSLKKHGLNISTGPVVPFRALEYLDDAGEYPATHAPLLWMQHVHPLKVTWPKATRKAQYIKTSQGARILLVPNRNYVLLRRFSAKEESRRLTAAPFLAKEIRGDWVGLENHLNYIYRPGGSLSDDEAWGLAALYSSALLDIYFRVSNGNTQVSATELRAMPLPDLETIVALGREIRELSDPLAELDAVVMEMAVRNAGSSWSSNSAAVPSAASK